MKKSALWVLALTVLVTALITIPMESPHRHTAHAALGEQVMTSNFEEIATIPTSGARDWEFFTIGNNHYLVVANSNDDMSFNIYSKIYKWSGSGFEEFQSIETNQAEDWESFTIDNIPYLVVANRNNGNTSMIYSKVYKWNSTDFTEFQPIATNGVQDWHYFTIGNDSYLAAANFDDDYSKIYKWNGATFAEIQSIPTIGARDWEFFTIGSSHYLVVANAYDDTNMTWEVDSKIYQWNGTTFAEIQSIPTMGARDWEFFTIGSNHYLVVANAINDTTVNLESKLYKWNGTSFSEVQSIMTENAFDWEFFTIGIHNYLMVANRTNGSSHTIYSKLYEWNGTIFVEADSVLTQGATGWQHFTINGKAYLALANDYDGATHNIDSTIYRFIPDDTYLPLVLNKTATCYSGSLEIEPNNSREQATGPLCDGQIYQGAPNDAKDYFTFVTSNNGNIVIDLTGHSGTGVQMQLFYENETTPRAFDTDPGPDFHIAYSGPAGRYYIYIFTASGYGTTPLYNLIVNYP